MHMKRIVRMSVLGMMALGVLTQTTAWHAFIANLRAAGTQHPHSIGAQGKPFSLPMAVNGATEPERIPDDVAFNHLIMALSISSKPSKEELARRDAFLNRIELTNEDRAAFVKALQGVRDELDAITNARRSVRSEDLTALPALTKLAELKQRESVILQSARLRIALALTWDGSQRLETHIREHVKRRIVIYGDTQQ